MQSNSNHKPYWKYLSLLNSLFAVVDYARIIKPLPFQAPYKFLPNHRQNFTNLILGFDNCHERHLYCLFGLSLQVTDGMTGSILKALVFQISDWEFTSGSSYLCKDHDCHQGQK